MGDNTGLNGFADKIGFGLGDSKTVKNMANNLDLGKIADSTNVDSVSKKIKDNAIASVIEYEGDNSTFIWKHPIENFNTGSQLIVHESQEAVFFMNGEALDLFGPGRHTLETQNLPLVRKFFSAPTGGVTPFHCEVYFINKTEQMSIKWGTDSKLEYIEPLYKFPIKIGASGEMSLRVEDSRKLLIKVVGTEKVLTQQSLVQKFRAFLMTGIKAHMASQIKKQGINIFEIDENLAVLSEQLHEILLGDFADYGLSLERFFVSTIVKPEDDRAYQQFRDLHVRQYTDVAEARLRQQVDVIEQETQMQRTIIEAQGLAQKRSLEGYTYQQERGFEVAEKMAQNEGVGQMSNLGIGMGMISGIGGTVGQTVGGIVSNTMGEVLQPQENTQTHKETFEGRLAKLELLKGKIPDEVYNNKLQELLNEI